ncbi:MAG: hypothetical protein QN175_10585 [Armatimonadota bacterium]|nr:hypothetical protein [Armatimonadota bacterium]MDR7469487.1 hypothetical protein [Armatimonadota bacterium]MDR7475438.1 hypothetical protein [Armatimonadota bacterium]
MRKEILLKEIAFARSGDKGDTANIALFARRPEDYPLLVREVTAERVKAHFAGLVEGEVVCYEVPNLHGLQFVLRGALAGGGPLSLRLDNLGKNLGNALLKMRISAGNANGI